ncbi:MULTISPECIES: TadE/TadG family type IV pilus assembly protein [Agrobacterium]|uniref:Pilus assembly protein n=1 Tax=Agrobacterium tumefaciens TaxID=358 RepID=A0A546Y636_AGRTU|nr:MULTISPECIES: TadE/TadG family type IV pilus assembly protein [Agrobacterium]MBO0124712.1 pilus assembly protein [Agrobacterium sp. OT33]NSX89255.1 pilus assembly protein [Agrobacterium tumefaciens]NTE53902.1 pilus assembly protein [Agrobacterium tumefaciens]NTE70067.1 pilus assembly protein [Agrobacterium tumefaciens]TRB08444.1 pilus assembly protein [Agrobacterium tumefaciens]
MRLARLTPLLRKFGISRDGTAAIEFAILAIPYFLVVFAIIETFIALIAEQVVVNATDTMARRLRTGQLSSSISKEDFRKNFCNEVSVMITCSADEIKTEQKLYIDLRSFPAFKDIPTTIPLKAYGEYYDLDTAEFGFKPGGPETINMLRVYYRWRVIADIIRPYLTKIRPADGSMPSHFLIVATDAFMNEKYTTSGGL